MAFPRSARRSLLASATPHALSSGALCLSARFGDLTGVDYVPESVHLATAVAAAAGVAAHFQVRPLCILLHDDALERHA
jgi:hypothetical protein